MHFAGVNRIAFQAIDLGDFDFAVPIRAFYQTDHETVVGAACQINDEIQHRRTAFLIGLHHKTDAIKARQIFVLGDGFQQIQGQLQAVGLFGIDVQADVVFFCQQIQVFDFGQQFIHHAGVLVAVVAWVQSRQFH